MTKPSEQEAPEEVCKECRGTQPAGEGMTEARLAELRDILESHGSFDCTDSAERAIIDSSINALCSEVNRLRERERLLIELCRRAVAKVGDSYTWAEEMRAAIGK